MGREIRRVPPTWEHPTQDCPHSPWKGGCDHALRNGGKCFKPLHDEEYKDVADTYMQDCLAWSHGTYEGQTKEETERDPYFWDYSGAPPDRDSYRPAFTEEATHVQLYETVSEGTPVTPHFATKQELIDYLVAHGDFWDQHRGDDGWNRTAAERMINDEYAPSMISIFDGSGMTLKTPRDMGTL